jgi:hypothetical protein
MAGRQPGARLDEPCITLRDRHRKPGADECALAGPELDALAGRQVHPCVSRIGAFGNDGILPEALDRQLDQRARRTGSERASATR